MKKQLSGTSSKPKKEAPKGQTPRHNLKRTERMRTKPLGVLKQIASSGSLSSAAAVYALKTYHGVVFTVGLNNAD